MLFKDDKPPTSKEEAVERRVRPPPEKYDPDKRSHWSITMTLAWIIWGEIDAVRNEWDDYRNECADWVFENDPIARAQIGQIGPQKGSWHLHQWPPSGWNRLYLRAISKNILEPRQQAILPPQVAIDELWLAAGEGRIKATALECKNAKAFDGDRIEIPAHHWPHLKRTDDPLTGKAMLSDDQAGSTERFSFPDWTSKNFGQSHRRLSGEAARARRKTGAGADKASRAGVAGAKGQASPREPPVGARRALYPEALPGRHRRGLDRGNPQEARQG